MSDYTVTVPKTEDLAKFRAKFGRDLPSVVEMAARETGSGKPEVVDLARVAEQLQRDGYSLVNMNWDFKVLWANGDETRYRIEQEV